jgi:protein tyrosine/serine phosphatase
MKETSTYNFVKVGNGRLALYHRPRRMEFSHLRGAGCAHVVTLLKDSEGAEHIGNMTRNAGLKWIWLPVPNGDYPIGEIHQRLIQAMPQLSQLLDEGNSLLVHCSAGIHRTGTVAYGLLRWRGIEGNQAMRIIGEIRKITAEGMMEKRRRWGDENARQVFQQDKTWAHSVKEFLNQLTTKTFRSH